MVPAPKKPMPTMAAAHMTPATTLTPGAFRVMTSLRSFTSISAATQAPRHTSTWVRMPAGRFLYSRSTPTTRPMPSAVTIRIKSSHCSDMSIPP